LDGNEEEHAGDEQVVKVRSGNHHPAQHDFPFGDQGAKVALRASRTRRDPEMAHARETMPGSFPFTAGVFSFKRENEDPTRMFAGEVPFRPTAASICCRKTWRRSASRPAFDSVTLYGFDPDLRPDI